LSHADHFQRRRGLWGMAMVLGLIGALAIALLPGAADAKAKKKGTKLTVMTRNLYLGADLTPALQANNVDQAIDAGGEIVNQVHATKFPSVRAASIAAEIKKRKPDIVGLQEAALWRTGPVDLAAALGTPVATQVDPAGGDFLADLVNALNSKGKTASAAKKGKKKKGVQYTLAVVKPEFDFELPVNDDGNGHGLSGADHNERLTMRDAILVRKGVGVKFSQPTTGTFDTLLSENVAGVKTVDVTRGWTAINVKARGRSLHVVDTHLEAFDSQGSNTTNHGTTLGRGDVRAAQATQLVSPQPNGAVRAGKIPTILLGDMNSDDDTVQPNGDRNAYMALLAGGFTERSTANPLGCCLNDPFLVGGPNSINDFDHQVDHVLANRSKVKFVKGFVDGRAPVNGLYPSDHAALTSVLKIK
jgi:endonuclease/exonuclease/phosphatase family metal-dependent hydrolase